MAIDWADIDAALEVAREAERERCAKIAENWTGEIDEGGSLVPAPEGIAAAIRNVNR